MGNRDALSCRDSRVRGRAARDDRALFHGTAGEHNASHEDEATRQGDDRSDRVRDPFARHWLHRRHFINEKQAAACTTSLIGSVASTPHRAARQDRVRKLGLYGFSSSSVAELPV